MGEITSIIRINKLKYNTEIKDDEDIVILYTKLQSKKNKKQKKTKKQSHKKSHCQNQDPHHWEKLGCQADLLQDLFILFLLAMSILFQWAILFQNSY